MRPAIKDLLQLSDGRLFEEVATGIRLIVDHAESLESTAVRLHAIDEHHAAAIVRALAKEELAKVLILLDLIRCPRDQQDARSKTVWAFRDHLAKEIYANSCRWRPVDFAEVIGIVDRERRSYYLDGPNDVDWILPNYATTRRENRMYVDYVQDITVDNGEHDWVFPLPDLGREHKDATPSSLVVARALHRVGMTTPEGLAVVADHWRGFEPQPQTTRQELSERNYESLVRVSEARQDRKVDSEDATAVCHHWPFPLWPLELKQLKEPTREDLHRQRAEQIKWRLKRESERGPCWKRCSSRSLPSTPNGRTRRSDCTTFATSAGARSISCWSVPTDASSASRSRLRPPSGARTSTVSPPWPRSRGPPSNTACSSTGEHAPPFHRGPSRMHAVPLGDLMAALEPKILREQPKAAKGRSSPCRVCSII